jgi:hypothetical protein
MATDQTGKAIPGIPLAALDAVQDTKVRDVLRALVATHNVRNNLVGIGDEAFITARQAQRVVRIGNINDPLVAPRILARYARGDGGGTYTGGTLSGPLTTISLSLDRAISFRLLVNWQVAASVTGDSRIEVRDDSGNVLLAQSGSVRGSFSRSHVASSGIRLEAGEHTLTLHAGNPWRGVVEMHNWGILVMPVAG